MCRNRGRHSESACNKTDAAMSEKIALLEAAYDEYCRCQESSSRVDVEQFLRRYSTIRSSLRRQIYVHDFLAEHSNLVALCQDVEWPKIGDTVFNFTVLEELGRGAFARVYLCRQSGVGERQVVVKFAAEGAYEADTLGRLSHPNIMPVHSVEFDELTGRSAICMPFHGRATLCDLIDRTFAAPMTPPRGDTILRVAREDIGPEDQLDRGGPPDPFLKNCSYVDGVIHLGIQLAEAIAHAHERGVRHGDLKPSNVLLTASGRPVLLDFNLAVRDSAGKGAPGGTMPYMSPEQLAAFQAADAVLPEGDTVPENAAAPGDTAAEIDDRADVFSLGVILFELLSGELPFGDIAVGATAAERAKTLAAAQAKGPRSLRELNPHVDRRLAQLVEGCLAVAKARRPPSAVALAEELRGHLSLVSRSGRWTKRHKALAAGIVAAVVMSAGTAAAFFSLREPYPVRQYKQAAAEFNGGKMDEAIANLNPVIAAKPDDAAALFLRGLARMRLKEYQVALTDLEAARRVKSDPKILAAQAYCMCRLQYYREARFRYTEAMATGYDQVDAHNNLAYCYLWQKKFPQALALLDSAAELNPECAQIFLNRATIGLRAEYMGDKSRWEQILADCQRAIKLSPPNANIELLAAKIYSAHGRRDPRMLELSLEHLERACQLGLSEDKTALISSPDFTALKDFPRFQKAIEQLQKRGGNPLPDHLVEPSWALSAMAP